MTPDPARPFSRAPFVTTRRPLSRRRFLQGAGIALSLPFLESMLSGVVPAAKGEGPLAPGAKPRRMLAVCNNLGLLGDQFFPQGSGRDYVASPYLSLLQKHRADFSIFSGVSHPNVDGGHPADICFLTAAPHPGSSSFRNTISLDQYIAEHIGTRTRFPSITLGVNTRTRSLSWTGSGVAIPPEDRAAEVFKQMFIQGSPRQIEAQLRQLDNGKSILDTIAGQARELQRGVTARDRDRLDQYFTSVRDLENRLQASRGWETKPKPVVTAAAPIDPTNPAAYMEKVKIMYDLARLAFETDSTRDHHLDARRREHPGARPAGHHDFRRLPQPLPSRKVGEEALGAHHDRRMAHATPGRTPLGPQGRPRGGGYAPRSHHGPLWLELWRRQRAHLFQHAHAARGRWLPPWPAPRVQHDQQLPAAQPVRLHAPAFGPRERHLCVLHRYDAGSRAGMNRAACFRLTLALALLPQLAGLVRAALPGVVLDYTDRYCSSCHNDEDKKGRLDLASLAPDLASKPDLETWVKIHDRLAAGEMPPKEKPRPDAGETAVFLQALRATLLAHEGERVRRDGRATQRRLNGYEYENALRDLLSAPWLQIRGQFPDDGESHRFNKIGDALDVSHVHLARYLAAADYAIRQTLSVQLERPPTTTTRHYARDQRTLTSKFTPNPFNSSPDRMTYPVLGTTPQRDVRMLEAPLTVGASDPATREQEAVGWVSSNYVTGFTYRWDGFRAPVAGRYRIRFSGYTLWAAPGGVTRSGSPMARTRWARSGRPIPPRRTTIGFLRAAPRSPSPSTRATVCSTGAWARLTSPPSRRSTTSARSGCSPTRPWCPMPRASIARDRAISAIP
jgi:BMFP domain-containing protein YqiC